MKIALLQLTSGDDPAANLVQLQPMVEQAAQSGARLVLTPEVTNCVSLSRSRQNAVLQQEDDDVTLATLRDQAKALGIWLSIGSLALKTSDADVRFANRSFIIGPDGAVEARYDKIHMFDVDLGGGESFRESEAYRPGENAVLTEIDGVKVGLSVCYDLRFPHLYQRLAKAGAEVLLVPAAFSPTTGEAHWEPLLRARAIENGCYVVAAAQTGLHPSSNDRARSTYGHSLVVDPWGEVLMDAGVATGISFVEIEPSEVSKARARVPSLSNERPFEGPA